MLSPIVKKYSLTYREDTNTHYFTLWDSSDNKVFCVWMGNGDTRVVPVKELGKIIKVYDSIDDAEPTIIKLTNHNLTSGIDG